MAWQTRGNNHYFYRSVRENGRVRRQYLGRGPEAEAAADQIQQQRAADERGSELIAEELRQTEMARTLTDQCSREILTPVEAVLLAHRFHRAGAGPWRGRRHVKQSEED